MRAFLPMPDKRPLNFTILGNPQGKPLVVTHGWATDSNFTLPIAKILATRKIMLLDFPGYGVNADFENVDPYAESFVEYLHHSLPEKCDILSWSLSSLLAIELCDFDKGRKIDKLVTVCGTPRFPADPNWPGFSGHYVLQTKRLFTKIRFKKLLRLFYALQCQSNLNSKDNNEFIKEASLKMHIPSFEVLDRGIKSMTNIDLRVKLKNLQQPCLHLFGAHDNLVPAAQASILKRYAKHEVFIFDKSGHMPFLTESATFYAVVSAFLDRD